MLGPKDDANRDAAFDQFYRKSFVLLVSRCIRLGVPAADAPGIVQDLMLEIYRRWSEIRSAEAYAGRTIALRAAGFLQISSKTVSGSGTDSASFGQPLTSTLPDGVLAVDGKVLILEALDQLPQLQRAVFALAYDGFTCADIGEILNLKEATVRSHLRHARQRLRIWWIERAQIEGRRGDA